LFLKNEKRREYNQIITDAYKYKKMDVQQLIEENRVLTQKNSDLMKENRDLKEQLHFLLNREEREDTCQTNYSIITLHMAVGDYNSSYSTFQIVVDFSFSSASDKLYTLHNHFGKRVYRVNIKDEPSQKNTMLTLIEDLLPQLLEHTKDGQRILFHSQHGVSRSATMAIAYLCKKETLSYKDAYALLKEARPVIEPNNGFLEALQIFIGQ
jgi:hypothetical protein